MVGGGGSVELGVLLVPGAGEAPEPAADELAVEVGWGSLFPAVQAEPASSTSVANAGAAHRLMPE